MSNMKRVFLFIAIFVSHIAMGQTTDASEVLSQLIKKLKSYEHYSANVSVEVGTSTIEGYYEVDGEDYYVRIGEQELYGADGVKYEVYGDREEVIIDNISDKANNILDNPSKAFDFAELGFDSEYLDQSSDKQVVIRLIANVQNDMPIDHIDVTINKSTLLPSRLEYIFDTDTFVVNINDITKSTSPMKVYNQTNYSDFEVIDFR